MIENKVKHFNITQPPTLGTQYPYCPSWSEMWPGQLDMAGLSGAHVDDDDNS